MGSEFLISRGYARAYAMFGKDTKVGVIATPYPLEGGPAE